MKVLEYSRGIGKDLQLDAVTDQLVKEQLAAAAATTAHTTCAR
jgi:hypothetical protein